MRLGTKLANLMVLSLRQHLGCRGIGGFLLLSGAALGTPRRFERKEHYVKEKDNESKLGTK